MDCSGAGVATSFKFGVPLSELAMLGSRGVTLEV